MKYKHCKLFKSLFPIKLITRVLGLKLLKIFFLYYLYHVFNSCPVVYIAGVLTAILYL